MTDEINKEELSNEETGHLEQVVKVDGMFKDWFLDYASYVILDRAVPNIYDGLKPVQRRILHSLKEMDDGRLNKVANVVGNTMKYHPHGDMAIKDAMVGLGQKALLIDTQGNWGDPITGDAAAAGRYIEARLSKFANEVVFNAQTTNWLLSYDGRNQEPEILPVKFPLVLTQGTEGIAVGLATKILPHNFIELIDASIGVLNGEKSNLVPDFPTGGIADVSKYNEGQRGGKIRVRAKITERDKKTLVINEVPYGVTTEKLIDSIIKANDKGKIKIRKIEDNTSSNIEILIHLAPGISPDITINALFAFTDCEISISPNTCVIKNDKPHFMSVNAILEECTAWTKDLLRQELEIKLQELKERIFNNSLLKIFIQEGMYKNSSYENASNFDSVVKVLKTLFEPFNHLFYREILPEDFKKLTEKPMISITRFDVKDADEKMAQLEKESKVVEKNLKNLVAYAIAYFERIKEKYGKGRERKTEVKAFDAVEATQVALANVKLYVNREDGFVGTGNSLRKEEYVCDCSDIDDIIAFRQDGSFVVSKVSDKAFMGKNIIHVGVFKKNDERTIYNMLYLDCSNGSTYMKRFFVSGITRDKEYELHKAAEQGAKVLYFSANPNGEAEKLLVQFKPHPKIRKPSIDIDLAELAIKGRSSQGNVVTKYAIKKIVKKSDGVSTLVGRQIWYDENLQKLNIDGRGKYLGSFEGDDKIITIYNSGVYELSGYDLSKVFDSNLLVIGKYKPDMVVSAVHIDGKTKNYFVKRFVPDSVANKKISFIGEEQGSRLVVASISKQASVSVNILKGKTKEQEILSILLSDIIDVKGIKAIGNRLSLNEIVSVSLNTEVEETEVPIVSNEAVNDIVEEDTQIKLFE